MKNLMTSVKNALGIRAERCLGGGDRGLWRWYLYHSM